VKSNEEKIIQVEEGKVVSEKPYSSGGAPIEGCELADQCVTEERSGINNKMYH